MDLNLYLGFPQSPRPRSLDLGSDLALNSVPLSTLNSAESVEESVSPVVMPSTVEPAEQQSAVDFPSHPEYTPDLPSMLAADNSRANEYTPFFSSYESYGASFVPIPVAVSELQGPSSLYSSPIMQPSAALQESQETMAQVVVESHTPYDQVALPRLASETMAYSPPYVSGSEIQLDQEDANASLFPPIHTQLGDLVSAEDRPPLRPEPVPCPHSRIRRLIECNSRSATRRFRSSFANTGERSSIGSPSLPNGEQVLQDTRSPAIDCVTNAINEVPAEDIVIEASKEKRDEKDKNAGNFECNICFDMATEPVVTSCGHLFCWPCLYQWLHVHSNYKECPVCKGEVTEGNITPIYGRGNSSTEREKSEDPESSVKIPPRPQGSRLESFRQQFQPVARRLSEGIAPWRRLIDYMRSRHPYGPMADPEDQELLEGVRRRTLSRMRARRLQRGLNPQSTTENGEFGLQPSTSNIHNPASTAATSIFQDVFEVWHPLSLHSLDPERLGALTAADFGMMFGPYTSSNQRFGASTSAAEPPIPEPPRNEPFVSAALAADQISASSTMAVIQGDNATSDAMPDPNSAGTSRSHRRRGRSSSSGSFDVDGSNLNVRRRRLNQN